MPVGMGGEAINHEQEGRTTVLRTLLNLHLGVRDLPPIKAFGNDDVAIIGVTGTAE